MAIDLLYLSPEEKNLPTDRDFAALCGELSLTSLICPGVAAFFTTDPAVIRQRGELVALLLEDERLCGVLSYLSERLRDYDDIREKAMVTLEEQKYLRLLDAGFYVEFIDGLYERFAGIDVSKSEAIRRLAEHVAAEAEDPDFAALRANLDKLSQDVVHMKSITIGINLGSHLQPVEAGIVSLNTEVYRSDNFVDRMLRLDFSEDSFHCIAPLVPFKKSLNYDDRLRITEAVNGTLETICTEAVRRAHVKIKDFFYKRMEAFQGLGAQADFLLAARSFLLRLRERRVPLTVPVISQNEYHIEGMVNPDLALRQDSIVPNTAAFDDAGRIFILTGPNSGGKTVHLRAIAYAQAMLQLGLPVAAESAVMPVCTRILTMFPKIFTSGARAGRLEEECAELSGLLAKCGTSTLVLMDEVFSSTGASDAMVLAEGCLAKLRQSGCRAIFSTHLHELCDKVPDMNTKDGSTIDLLSAELSDGKRTFRIRRGEASRASDAVSIAEKYGLLG